MQDDDTPRRPSLSAYALLPLRLFFGATFLYAGIDKLILDRGFFDPASPTSIHAQFTIFERVSPLAPLVHLVEPLAPVLGALTAAIVIKMDDGSFVAYDALCTHEGCRVGYDTVAAVIYCPCHGAEFDPADHANVLAGLTNIPLAELPLVVDSAAGTLVLRYS
ncbi:MAG: Rieske 2Fe-2S domain-containing protein [Chloroflexota bacterium]